MIQVPSGTIATKVTVTVCSVFLFHKDPGAYGTIVATVTLTLYRVMTDLYIS